MKDFSGLVTAIALLVVALTTGARLAELTKKVQAIEAKIALLEAKK